MSVAGVMLMMQLAAEEPSACLRSLNAVNRGAVAVAQDFEPARCAEAAPAFVYDSGIHVARLRRDLAPGETVRGPASVLSAVRPGAKLILEARVGPVLIQRQVEILRPARPGERVIVRGDDGRVFAAPAPRAGS